jgi:aminopeptidase N
MDGYDVRFYRLVLDLNPTTQILTGTATVEAVVTAAPLTQVQLDLDAGMSVSAARAGGSAASLAHSAGILTVDLDRAYAAGELVTVEIDYSGNPSDPDYFGWSTYGGQPLIWTLSEPYGARVWWPCKDLNTDKADSVALDVTVPSNLVVASNGVQEAVTTPVAGRTTYHWRERYPICTYLVSVTAHPYSVINDVYYPIAGGTMPVVHYVVPGQLAAATTGFAVTVDMLGAFADAFGEYPFVDEKYGHAQFPWGGGMEHQTCTSLYYGTYDEGIIAHELGHQWFGDLITCADFSHIWLNEGFATWLEAYWKEVDNGTVAYHQEMAAARYLGAGTIFVEDPSNFWGIFDYNLSYQKASWVPHMLRHLMGDAAFFAGLQQYRAERGFGSATTEQFQAVMEAASGKDLDAFFQQWIYGEYYPRYDFAWTSEPAGAGWRVRLRIEQSQTNTGLFTMPLDVRIETEAGALTFVVQNDRAEQWYAFEVPSAPLGLALDPENWVLCEKRFLGTSDVPLVAATVRLLGAAPNPFNPRTTVRFSLPRDVEVRLDLHDAAGRLVAVLAEGAFPAGEHGVAWDGRDRHGRAAASGTYYARLRAGGDVGTVPLTLVR